MDKGLKKNEKGQTKRAWSGTIHLYMPKEEWVKKLIEYNTMKITKDSFGKACWKPLRHRNAVLLVEARWKISKNPSGVICETAPLSSG